MALAAYLLAHANGLFLRQRSTRSAAPTPSGIGQTIGLLLGFLAALLLDRRGTLAYALGSANGAATAAGARHVPLRLAVEWGKGTVWGLLMAIVPIFFFLRPVVLARPVEHPTYTNLTRWAWLRLVLVELPFFTALPEEAAWRGALEPRLVAHLGAVARPDLVERGLWAGSLRGHTRQRRYRRSRRAAPALAADPGWDGSNQCRRGRVQPRPRADRGRWSAPARPIGRSTPR